MPKGPDLFATSPTVPSRQEGLLGALCLLASALLLITAYLQYSVQGSWFSSAQPLSWDGSRLSLSKGHGLGGQGRLTIDATDDEGVAVASLTTPVFWAQDYTSVRWRLDGARPGSGMVFLWRTLEKPGRVFARPLSWTAQGPAPLQMAGDEDWSGQITGLALMVKGELTTPVSVQSVSLQPASARAALEKLLGKWLAAAPWQGASINFLDADALEQTPPMLLAMAAWLFLALAGVLLLARFKLSGLHPALLWGLVFFVWFALDARWQWNLFRQLDATRQQYAGKSADARHLEAEDGGLFKYLQQVKAKMPSSPGRILYFSDDPYLRGRGAYHLLPLNVFNQWHRQDMPVAQWFKPGDIVLLIAKQGVTYDAGREAMLWDEARQSLPVDLLTSGVDSFLLKVR